VLVIGLLLVPRGTGDIVVVAAVVWLVGANLLATRIEPTHPFPSYFWVTDFLLLSVLLLTMQIDFGLGAALLAAAAHLSVVICEKSPFGWASAVVASAGVLVLDAGFHQGADLKVLIAAVALVLVSALETAWLVRRAQNHHK